MTGFPDIPLPSTTSPTTYHLDSKTKTPSHLELQNSPTYQILVMLAAMNSRVGVLDYSAFNNQLQGEQKLMHTYFFGH